MTPKPLSQWADEQGVPRRTAYNWANQGKLPVPYRRTITGRVVVLDDEPAAADVHPFIEAYAEALGGPGRHAIDHRERYNDHSPVLEAWGADLYDSVATELRPVVLQLAVAAASRRLKRDVPARLSDWLNRVELAAWFTATGFDDAAAMVRQLAPITDADSFFDNWLSMPGNHELWEQIDQAVRARAKQLQGPLIDDTGAAASLGENGLIGLDLIPIAGRRASLRTVLSKLAKPDPDGDAPRDIVLPDRGELWDLRSTYGESMWALARPVTYRTARAVCELVGWDPDAPPPPEGHQLFEVGWNACTAASMEALRPQIHLAHLREIEAFRRIALGLPFIADHP